MLLSEQLVQGLEEARSFETIEVPGIGKVEFVLDSVGRLRGPSVEAWKGDKEIGSMTTKPSEYGGQKVFAVTDVEVDPGYQGKGLADQMYRLIAALAKKHGRALASDTWLDSPATRHIWGKLEKMGKATKVPVGDDAGYVLDGAWPAAA